MQTSFNGIPRPMRVCVLFNLLAILTSFAPGCSGAAPPQQTPCPHDELTAHLAELPVVAVLGNAEVSPGQSSSDIVGCLEAPPAGAEPGEPPVARGPTSASDELDIEAHPWGLFVRHTLSHPCCLDGKVHTVVENHVVRIRETISGQPCRCICESTLATRVGLEQGEYEVELVLVLNGEERSLAYAAFEVEGLLAPVLDHEP